MKQLKTLLLPLVVTTGLYAQIFDVSTTAAFRTALSDAAQNGENDTINLADGTYTTTDDEGGTFIFLDDEDYNLTLIGSSSENVILSGAGEDQIFNHESSSGAHLNIEKLTFMDGGRYDSPRSINGAGFAVLNADIEISDCNFTNNHALNGGGFYTASLFAENIQITNTTFSNNSARGNAQTSGEGKGGGFYTLGATVTIKNSTFINNSATVENAYYSGTGVGGGFYAFSAIIEKSTFTNNHTDGVGGGFYCGYTTDSDVKITDSNFTDNKAITDISDPYTYGQGGGFHAQGDTTIENCNFHKNIAGDAGGGFLGGYNTTSTTIIKSIFTENSILSASIVAEGGAAFYSLSSNTILLNSIVKDNNSSSAAGAFKVTEDAVIVNSIITNNNCQRQGVVSSYRKVYMSNSIMSDNSSGITIRIGTEEDPSIIKNTAFLGDHDSNISAMYEGEGPIVSLSNNYMNTDNVQIENIMSNNIFEPTILGFTDAANGDYSLTAESELIDAGTNDFADKFIVDGVDYLETDYVGNRRSAGSSMDIGIYEYGSTKSIMSPSIVMYLLN